tara:strand:- start:1974 stop:2714 length:741 start_codon:yes stop_codon:yes gene_type:complete
MIPRKKQYENLFKSLNKFMLTNDNIMRYSNISKPNIPNKKLVVNKKQNCKQNCKQSDNIFIPRQKDVLFWCFYIILYGEDKYLFNINNRFSIEKEIKIKAIEILKTKKDILKEKKLKKYELENELLNEKSITIIGLSGLCIAYNVSICVVKNRTIHDLRYNNIINGVIYWDKNNYGVYNIDIIKYYNEIIHQYYIISNPNKPLKAISGYTIKELIEICKQLNISIIDANGMKHKKSELYKNIQAIL